MIRTALYAAGGVLFGVFAKWIDAVAASLDSAAGATVSGLGSAPAAWMLVVVAVAVAERRRAGEAVARATVLFLGLCVGYYAYSQLVLGFSGLGLVAFWLVAALTLVPITVLLVRWAFPVANASDASPRRLVAWCASGMVLGVSVVQTLGYALLAADPASRPEEGAVPLTIGSLAIAIGTWLTLARTPAARLAIPTVAVVLAWPAWLALDALFRLLTAFAR